MISTIDALRMYVIAKAEEVAETFMGKPEEIQELVDNHEFVAAVWEDKEQPDGHGIAFLKGQPPIVAGHFYTGGSWTAIPCTSVHQAEAIQMCVMTGVPIGEPPPAKSR